MSMLPCLDLTLPTKMSLIMYRYVTLQIFTRRWAFLRFGRFFCADTFR